MLSYLGAFLALCIALIVCLVIGLFGNKFLIIQKKKKKTEKQTQHPHTGEFPLFGVFIEAHASNPYCWEKKKKSWFFFPPIVGEKKETCP